MVAGLNLSKGLEKISSLFLISCIYVILLGRLIGRTLHSLTMEELQYV